MERVFITFIFARGGSVRLPNKNLRLICGKPLIAWSILQSKNSHHVSRTFVITDSKEIAAVSKSYGAEIIPQPTWQCQFGTRGGGVAQAWAMLRTEETGIEYTHAFTMLPTNPLRKPHEVDALADLLIRENADSAGCRACIHHFNVARQISEHQFEQIVAGDDEFWTSNCFLGVQSKEFITYNMTGGKSVMTRELFYDWVDERTQQGMTIPGYKHVTMHIDEWQLIEIDFDHDAHVCETLLREKILSNGNAYEWYGKERIYKRDKR